ncbi:protein of unknown function [Streptomyces murinus]
MTTRNGRSGWTLSHLQPLRGTRYERLSPLTMKALGHPLRNARRSFDTFSVVLRREVLHAAYLAVQPGNPLPVSDLLAT